MNSNHENEPKMSFFFHYISFKRNHLGSHLLCLPSTAIARRSNANNSPTTLRLSCCCDVCVVMLLRAEHVYCPLWLVEKICTFRVPPFAWLAVSGAPLNCHDKRAGGRDTDVQVSWTVWPMVASPPPTQLEDVFVTWGVSGPSEADTTLYVIRHIH